MQLFYDDRDIASHQSRGTHIEALAAKVGTAFNSRLVVADFARDVQGKWIFIEAGPGSCAGTAHEQVFKSVAARLRGEESSFSQDDVGGVFHRGG